MDIKLDKNDIMICNIESVSGEQAFESDILLPDYYQDIMKVLKCTATPVILKTNLINNKIMVDFVVYIKVYYQTVENKIRSISSKIDFSKNFDIDFQTDNLYIVPKITLDYINCRAINERKIDIKGSLSIKVKIFNNFKENVLANAQGAGIQIKNDKIKNMTIIGNNNNQFIIKQDVLLDNVKPDVGNVISYDVKIENIDKKIIDNKIIVKGNVKLKILYTSVGDDDENKSPTTFETELNFNQIIDIPGVSPSDQCETDIDLIWSEITPKSDNDGRNRLFSVDFSFNISVKCHKQIESDVVIDSYSTQKEINYITKKIDCYNLVDKIAEKISIEANIALPDMGNLQNFQILDIWNLPKIVLSKISNSDLSNKNSSNSDLANQQVIGRSLVIEGKTELSILGLDDNNPVYIEKFIDFEKTMLINNLNNNLDSNFKFDFDIKPQNILYNINYDSLDIKIDLLLTGYIYQNDAKEVVKEIEVDENSEPKMKRDLNSLIVYYANPGEDVWQLAKKYNTSISAILEENEEIEDNVINQKMMLLIPIIN